MEIETDMLCSTRGAITCILLACLAGVETSWAGRLAKDTCKIDREPKRTPRRGIALMPAKRQTLLMDKAPNVTAIVSHYTTRRGCKQFVAVRRGKVLICSCLEILLEPNSENPLNFLDFTRASSTPRNL